MLIGIDFDNTLVSYDRLFRRIAVERGLVPETLPASKGVIRDHLRAAGREGDWTEMQGLAYGPRMGEATPFEGAIDFFQHCRRRGVPVWIISHRSLHPYAGERHDLHRAARDWLAAAGLHDPAGAGLPPERTHFELTKAHKLGRIASVGCTHFIDDLPELLADPAFPAGVQKILFDPNRLHPDSPGVCRAESWGAIARLLLGEPS